jgi:hypothetical protein
MMLSEIAPSPNPSQHNVVSRVVEPKLFIPVPVQNLEKFRLRFDPDPDPRPYLAVLDIKKFVHYYCT